MIATPTATMRVTLLSLAIAIGQLATSLYLPALPAVARDLAVGSAAASWTLTAFYVGFAVCNLVAGPMADALGRRPVLLGGLALYVVGTLFCAVASSILFFLVGRMIQAAGASAAPVVGRAMLRDVQGIGNGTKAMIWVSIAMAAAPALGPPLGGLIQQTLGWRWAFWALAAAGLAMLAVIYLMLDETLSAAARVRSRGLGKRYFDLLGDGAYCWNVGALSCLFAGLGVFFATGPFIFIQMLGFSPVIYGLLNILNVVGYLTGSALAGRLSRRMGPGTLVRGGTLLALAGGVAMVALAASGVFAAWSVLVPVVVLTAGFGIVLPAATAGALDRHPSHAGLASALLGFIQVGAAAAGTAVAGAFLGYGILSIASVFLVLTAMAALFAWRLGAVSLPSAVPL